MKNVRSIRGLALTGVAALGLIAMTPALADSDFAIGNSGTLTAEADLAFEIVIPRFLYLQVGSADTNVNEVSFDLAGGVTDFAGTSTVGNGTTVDGDVTVGVRLVSNAGDIALEAEGSGTGLTNGPAPGNDEILWSEITGVASTGTLSGGLDVPQVGSSVTVGATNGVVNRSDTWSFDYLNSALVGGGTYTGTVTYTATSL